MLCELTHYICVFVLSTWVRYCGLGIVNWISAYDFTHFMSNAHLREELILYCPSKFLHLF
jgi:hypothetical protein